MQQVEIGFLHRRDKEDASKVIWQNATLASANQITTTWQIQVPAGLEGIYDLSLRAKDALGNQRTLPAVWTGLIDTQAPQITVGGTTPGQQSCTVTDFSLGRNTFVCGNISNASNASTALYASGVLTPAGLTWNATWYRDLFLRRVPQERLYALYQSGANLSSNPKAESCDLYGNCTRCTMSNGVAACSTYTPTAALRSTLAEPETGDDLSTPTEMIGPGFFTATVRYERPDAYVPGQQPASPTSTWITVTEPYILVDDAVLASTRPFAGDFTQASTEIAWSESVSATQYYVGWTLTETVVISDLTAYAEPGVHSQSLPDQGRYYAHVVAVDAAERDQRLQPRADLL